MYVGCILEYFKKYMFIEHYSMKPSIVRTLEKQPSLSAELDEIFSSLKINDYVDFNADKVESVLVKLAQGHLLKDFSEIYLRHEPEHLVYMFINELSQEELKRFNSPLLLFDKTPEIGSRNMYIFEADDERYLAYMWEVMWNVSNRQLEGGGMDDWFDNRH